MPIVKHLIDAAKGKHPLGAARSNHWPTVRKHFIEKNPCCVVCGGTEKLQVHHRHPFHLHPELELDEANLITLCEAPGRNCHLVFGHLLNFRSFNPNVGADAAAWHDKIKSRPLSDKEQA